MRRQEVWTAAQCFLKLCYCRLGLPLGGQHRAQVVVARRLIWLQPDYRAIRRRRLVQVAGADVELAEMGIGLGKIRCQAQHSLKLCFGLGCLALLSVSQANPLHGGYQARMALQGLLKVADGLLIATGMQGIFAETIRRFGQVLVEMRRSAVHLVSEVVQPYVFEVEGELHEEIGLRHGLAQRFQQRQGGGALPLLPVQLDEVLLGDIVRRLALQHLLPGRDGVLPVPGLIMRHGSVFEGQQGICGARHRGRRCYGLRRSGAAFTGYKSGIQGQMAKDLDASGRPGDFEAVRLLVRGQPKGHGSGAL